MRFPYLPVTSLEDATGNFEALQTLSRFSRGLATVTFAGGTSSASATVNHGLPAIPLAVLTSQQNGIQPGGALVFDRAQSITASSFLVFVQTADGSQPAAGALTTVAWVALL